MVVYKFLKYLVTRTTDTLINGKHGQGTHSTKMGADKLPQNLSAQAKSLRFR